jgi:uncharacterized protein
MTAPIQPLPQSSADGRLTSLDFTRGVAVMGILAANIIGFGQPFLAYFWPGGFATSPQPGDAWLWLAQFTLVDGKMRGLFSLLFGAGLALFADRARANGASEWLQVRRLTWLFAFGLAHFYLLWRGDILALYALCGLIVLPLLRWPPIVQFAGAMTGYIAGAMWNCLIFGAWWASGADRAAPADARSDAAKELLIAADGRYSDYVLHAFVDHRFDWLDAFAQTFAETVPLMLMGAALYRAGLFDGRVDARLQRRWGWLGVGGGTALTLLIGAWAMADGLTYTGTLLAALGPQALTRLPVVLGLVALLGLMGSQATGWLGRRVIAAGRMAFSNYLGTSMAMLFVFQVGGLYGALGRVELYAAVLAAWAVMLAWSGPWLARFRFGPLEWLWRCLTYGRLVSIRK